MKSLYILFLMFLFVSIENCNVKDAIDELFIDISGNVSEDGIDVEGALIFLVDSPNLADGLSLSNGSITGANGNYTILNVEAGDYYVVAVDDVNGNFEYDSDTDRFGFFGVDIEGLDLVPDQVSVTDEDIENIDITYLTSLQ